MVLKSGPRRLRDDPVGAISLRPVAASLLVMKV